MSYFIIWFFFLKYATDFFFLLGILGHLIQALKADNVLCEQIISK